MAIFKQGDNSCYFIHIPRTGGRYVSSLFENTTGIECSHHKIHTERINGIDVTHLHYPLYDLHFNVNKIPHIAVVRNPFDKFHSSVRNMHFIHKTDYNEFLKTEESFLDFINNEILNLSYHNNWFLPQNKFISPNTHIWKYEWGFGSRFKKWVYEKTNIDISIKKVNYERFENETDNDYKLDKRIKKYVKKFYKEDYKRFGYSTFI